MEHTMTIVNKAIEVFNATPIEQYPEARAIDKLEELTPVNSRERQYAYNVFAFWLENKEA